MYKYIYIYNVYMIYVYIYIILYIYIYNFALSNIGDPPWRTPPKAAVSSPRGWRPKGQAEDRSPGKVSHAEPHLLGHNVVASYL